MVLGFVLFLAKQREWGKGKACQSHVCDRGGGGQHCVTPASVTWVSGSFPYKADQAHVITSAKPPQHHPGTEPASTSCHSQAKGFSLSFLEQSFPEVQALD